MSERLDNQLARVTAAILAGVSIGVCAGALQQTGDALVVIQSLAMGALLGITTLGAFAAIGAPPPSWRFVVFACVIAVTTQHLRLYRAAMIAREKAVRAEPAAELFKPGWSQESLVSYFQSEAATGAVWFWLLDACLLTLAAVVIVKWGRRGRGQSS